MTGYARTYTCSTFEIGIYVRCWIALKRTSVIIKISTTTTQTATISKTSFAGRNTSCTTVVSWIRKESRRTSRPANTPRQEEVSHTRHTWSKWLTVDAVGLTGLTCHIVWVAVICKESQRTFIQTTVQMQHSPHTGSAIILTHAATFAGVMATETSV